MLSVEAVKIKSAKLLESGQKVVINVLTFNNQLMEHDDLLNRGSSSQWSPFGTLKYETLLDSLGNSWDEQIFFIPWGVQTMGNRGSYLLHPQFFILICNILNFTSFQFHPRGFISIYQYYLFHSWDFILISSS